MAMREDANQTEPPIKRRELLEQSDPTTETGGVESGFQWQAHATRRKMLSGLAALATAGVVSGTVAASGRDPEEIPLPEVEGPITGGSRTGKPKESDPRDLSAWGYVEEEYFLSGEAIALGPPGLQADVADDVGDVSPYTTRMIVWRPEEMTAGSGIPARGAPGGIPSGGPPEDVPRGGGRGFSGTVMINWPNQTIQEDNPVTIMNCLDYLAEQGHIGILLSAQKQGVDGSPLGCRFWDPVRYGDLEHPGDSYSYDILSQCTKLLKEGPAGGSGSVDPLYGHRAEQVYASGVSQSAGMLLEYINRVQEMHGVVDGFMPFNTSSTPQQRDDIRDDLVPILWLTSEDEASVERREDAGLFKLWEVAGASHVNAYTSYWREQVRNRDQGSIGGVGHPEEWDEAKAGQYGEMGSGICITQGNYFPYRYALDAAIKHLDEWVRDGDEPPTADRIARDEDGNVQYDEHGNALGGLRLPPIDVPVAEYQATSCEEYDTLFGQTIQFRTAKLEELYPTHEQYVAELEAAAEDAIEAGFLLERDADDLLRRARRSDIPHGELP